MRSILIILTLTFAFTSAFAFTRASTGGEVGNGGNVIVCADTAGKVKSVEVLDYYELRLNGGALSLNPNLATYQEKLFELFNRWREVAPKRMEQYTKWLNEFQAEAGIHSGIEIPHIPDTGSIAIPQGCKPISIAFQRADDEIFPGTKRYVINKDLWDYMNETQKAGLVLHELIYREAIKAAHATSLPTRYLNGYLSSATPKGEEYSYIVSRLPLLWVEYGGGMILQIGVVGCGGFGGPGCRFERRSVLNADGSSINAVIAEVFDNVETEEVKINFDGFTKKMDTKTSKFIFQSGESILLYMDEGKRYFSLKEIYAKNLLHLSSISEFELYGTFRFSIVKMSEMELPSGSDGPITIDSNSWVMNSNKVVIENIKTLNYAGRVIQDSSGRTWTLDTNIYK